MDDAGIELADRVRALLIGEPTLEEKRMFGTRAFLVNGRILVGARGGGTLLVRLTDEHGAALLIEPGVQVALMGARTMGTRWLDVDAGVIEDDDALIGWIDAAREDNAAEGASHGSDA
ncbi:TfoX/Sxy family protein [Microbacterium sp. H1-D42]|uniref:TfoX/Sxy family protein n=1 Tax=Microbacterium sp. H1-D42 TaxID=2925844 RepID=UPI001F53407C|nr:TfoX/Sxy family protein [Microbacterium sp. H1-D42]UNK72157.1 TfoX/Sxy family protein [Microbacterium sp. H1-D42]